MLKADKSAFLHYRRQDGNPRSLRHNWVIALYRDTGGQFWIGTFGGGLHRMTKEGGFSAFTEQDGLPSNVVHAILEDAQGRLWVSTNKGLCRFDPATRTFERFDGASGLESVQFHLGSRLRTRSGAMLFGTWNGFYHFDPATIVPNPNVPPIVITRLRVFNKPRQTAVAISHASEIRLSHEENIFSLGVAVLDFTFPRRNSYSYRLEGFSDQWIDLGNERDVSFTNLDPGAYVFQVRGSNSDGVWSKTARHLRIVITPPFWATWWWRTLCVLAFAGLLLAAHTFRLRALQARKRELEENVEAALSRVKVLKGLLPICANCRKVRDDKGYWSQLEGYIRNHTDADFSHGICPSCMAACYPEYYEKIKDEG
jgi:hypothetical protein